LGFLSGKAEIIDDKFSLSLRIFFGATLVVSIKLLASEHVEVHPRSFWCFHQCKLSKHFAVA
jgi:hypothetical protein